MTIELLNKYREILKLEPVEELDSILKKYQIALTKYYETDLENVQKLNLIIEAFRYFTGMEKDSNIEKLDEIKLKEQKTHFNNTRKLCLLFSDISKKLLEDTSDGWKFDQNYGVVTNFLSTIVPIYEYEEQKVYKK